MPLRAIFKFEINNKVCKKQAKSFAEFQLTLLNVFNQIIFMNSMVFIPTKIQIGDNFNFKMNQIPAN